MEGVATGSEPSGGHKAACPVSAVAVALPQPCVFKVTSRMRDARARTTGLQGIAKRYQKLLEGHGGKRICIEDKKRLPLVGGSLSCRRVTMDDGLKSYF